jgi:tRNA uridine 5-carbamoylmethylation protein Kti12
MASASSSSASTSPAFSSPPSTPHQTVDPKYLPSDLIVSPVEDLIPSAQEFIHDKLAHGALGRSWQTHRQNEMKATVSIVLMVGLPGSAKSTLCKFIIDQFLSEWDQIAHLEYDQITRQILANNQEERGPSSSHHDTLNAWKHSRNIALQQLNLIIEQVMTTVQKNASSSQEHHVVVLLDDNFHLRSMRKNIYKSVLQFAQSSHTYSDIHRMGHQLSLHFSTIFLEVPVDTCLQRNALRDGQSRVPESVIHHMASRIEGSSVIIRSDGRNNHVAPFEKHFMILYDEDIQLLRSTDRAVHSSFREKLFTFLSCSKSLPGVDIALLHRIRQQNDVDNGSHVEPQNPSLLQITDLLLRFLVHVTCRENRIFAPVANKVRKQILDQIKQKGVDHDACGEIKVWNQIIFQSFSAQLVTSLSNNPATTPDNTSPERKTDLSIIENLVSILDRAMSDYDTKNIDYLCYYCPQGCYRPFVDHVAASPRY